MAICRVGDEGVLKSEEEGMEIEERKSESCCKVGRVNLCTTVCFVFASSSGGFEMAILLLLLNLSSISSTSSSVWRMTVHPGGKAEWWTSRELDLKL